MFAALPRPLLFAHRGASLQAPENTLEAFDLAARLGADVLELDVHLSKDGEVVVLHDATLERTTNGSGPVGACTYAELLELDAGHHFTRAGGEHPFRGAGLHIPRLEEVLRGFPDRGFNIEVKARQPGLVQAVLRLLKDVDPERVLLAAADPAIMEELEAARPACALGLSKPQAIDVVWRAFLGRLDDSLRGRALQIPPRYGPMPVLSRRLVDAAHRAGVEVHVWTINNGAQARRYLHLGIDGIMTDDPAALLAVVDAVRSSTAPSGASNN